MARVDYNNLVSGVEWRRVTCLLHTVIFANPKAVAAPSFPVSFSHLTWPGPHFYMDAMTGKAKDGLDSFLGRGLRRIRRRALGSLGISGKNRGNGVSCPQIIVVVVGELDSKGRRAMTGCSESGESSVGDSISMLMIGSKRGLLGGRRLLAIGLLLLLLLLSKPMLPLLSPRRLATLRGLMGNRKAGNAQASRWHDSNESGRPRESGSRGGAAFLLQRGEAGGVVYRLLQVLEEEVASSWWARFLVANFGGSKKPRFPTVERGVSNIVKESEMFIVYSSWLKLNREGQQEDTTLKDTLASIYILYE